MSTRNKLLLNTRTVPLNLSPPPHYTWDCPYTHNIASLRSYQCDGCAGPSSGRRWGTSEPNPFSLSREAVAFPSLSSQQAQIILIDAARSNVRWIGYAREAILH